MSSFMITVDISETSSNVVFVNTVKKVDSYDCENYWLRRNIWDKVESKHLWELHEVSLETPVKLPC